MIPLDAAVLLGVAYVAAASLGVWLVMAISDDQEVSTEVRVRRIAYAILWPLPLAANLVWLVIHTIDLLLSALVGVDMKW